MRGFHVGRGFHVRVRFGVWGGFGVGGGYSVDVFPSEIHYFVVIVAILSYRDPKNFF